MNEDALRAIIRESIARHLGAGARHDTVPAVHRPERSSAMRATIDTRFPTRMDRA